ncbi:MAG TPA: hypothetical protein VGG03_14295 [Thermoanaerobaculia bacterium]|jgi:hypothetical protein
MLKRLLLGLLAAWAAAGFLVEVNRALTGYDGRERSAADPWAWRLGAPQHIALERCLAPARRMIPPHTALMFIAPDVPPGNAPYRWMWAAYLMPQHDVLAAGDPAAAALAQYVIACGTRIEGSWAVPVRDLPGGRLYRVRRP